MPDGPRSARCLVQSHRRGSIDIRSGYRPRRTRRYSPWHYRTPFRKQTVTSQHRASDGFSPLFSNASTDHESPVNVTAPGAAQKRSELHGDHHLVFVDPADTAGKSTDR